MFQFVSRNIEEIICQIRKAENEFERIPNSVTLLAVSKSHSVEKIKAAVAAGQKRFAESYLQEALLKINAFREYPDCDLEWHFIGAIQTNKARFIATYFDWVHSIAGLKTAQKLNCYRPTTLPPLNVCIQVNISEEKNKNGVRLDELPELAVIISQMKRLRLRGLMAIPARALLFEEQKQEFNRLREAQCQLLKQGLSLDVLSMGMTGDFRAAIAAGSTMVRIGTGIFGSR